MPQVRLFKNSKMDFVAYGGPPGAARIAHLIGNSSRIAGDCDAGGGNLYVGHGAA